MRPFAEGNAERVRRAAAILLSIAMLLASAACARRRTVRAVTPRIGQTETGIASWYGEPYHGRRAANGEIFDMEQLTAAHRTFAFGTWVRVHNLGNGRDVDVRITDRGPFIRGRIIDLSRAAAREVDMLLAGLAKVKLEVIRPPARVEPGAPGSGERFAVQAGAFRERDNAERLRFQLEREYGSARLVLRDTRVPLWRVLVGSFDRIEEAEQLAARIRRVTGESLVVRAGE